MERNSGMGTHGVLGVAADASVEEIRAAYRRRVRELHADRHLGADGSITLEAHEEFCALSRALSGALAAARPSTPRQGGSPVSGAPAGPLKATSAVPRQRRGWDRVRRTDAVHALLALPARTAGEWSNEQIETWALLVVPAARRELTEAAAAAERAGATGRETSINATAHVLLGLTLTALGTRLEVLAGRVGGSRSPRTASGPGPSRPWSPSAWPAWASSSWTGSPLCSAEGATTVVR
jgi:hypothetical protein